MNVFYSNEIEDGHLRLAPDEAAHCLLVMRYKKGDGINVIDGRGSLYRCVIEETSQGGRRGGAEVVARIESAEPDWGGHPYNLTLGVCPTKNIERFEWFAEKAVELGLDTLAPLFGERSERRALNTERLGRILLSAAKQSLKGAVTRLEPPRSVKEFIAGFGGAPSGTDSDGLNVYSNVSERQNVYSNVSGRQLRLIAYCSDEICPRTSIMEEIGSFLGVFGNAETLQQTSCAASSGKTASQATYACLRENGAGAASGIAVEKTSEISGGKPEIVVLIGPEGDFSPEEVRLAMDAGFVPVSLGSSRLRTETAALTAAEAVYLSCLGL